MRKELGVSMANLYMISGISRQGYHKSIRKVHNDCILWQRLREIVLDVRKDYPRASSRKIHYMFRMEGVVGINRFEKFVAKQGLGVPRQRSFIRTTYSGPTYYPNRINGIQLNGINQLWVSDITYYITKEKVFYIVLILDVYSRRTIGYTASNNMMAINNMKALEMAFKTRRKYKYKGLIHHSDKGSQYISSEYSKKLSAAGIEISMAGTCLENPYAERINGLIKNDYLSVFAIKSLYQLQMALKKAVNRYNNFPHGQLGMSSPQGFENLLEQMPQEQHPVMQLYDYEKSKAENVKMGFKRHGTMKIAIKEKTVASQNKTTVNHFPGSDYSSEGCSPAEPSSA